MLACAVLAVGLTVRLWPESPTVITDPTSAGAGTPSVTPTVQPSSTTPTPTPTATAMATVTGQPVTLVADGWTCTPMADEKLICDGEASSVLVVMRPAWSHATYLHDPDKAAPGQYVSDVHDGRFVTMEAVPDTVDLVALAEHLVWR